MLEGRRVTDKETLDVVIMTYAGLLNKKLVSKLQKLSCNAIGLSGADANLIQAKKRNIENVRDDESSASDDSNDIEEIESENKNENKLFIKLKYNFNYNN